MPRAKKHSLQVRLNCLAQAIAKMPDTPLRRRLTHSECQPLLEFYVDRVFRGENARAIYPAIWKHLSGCVQCRTSFDLIIEALREPTSQINLPVTVPAFISPCGDSPWNTSVCSCVGGAPLGFAFVIPPHYLQQRLAASQALLVRNKSGESGKTLLLADTITLGRHDVAIKLWLRQPTPSAQVQIEISLASVPLPEPFRITLRLNSHRYSRIIRHGQCAIKNIPLAALSNAGLCRVKFQAGSLSPSIEDVRAKTR
jgi:hypothetical protein